MQLPLFVCQQLRSCSPCLHRAWDIYKEATASSFAGVALSPHPGVIATEVGYSQGKVEDPTYEDVCSGQTGHVEVVQVTYNSQEVGGSHAPKRAPLLFCDLRTVYSSKPVCMQLTPGSTSSRRLIHVREPANVQE